MKFLKIRLIAPLLGVGLLGLFPATTSNAVEDKPKELGVDKPVPWEKSARKPSGKSISSTRSKKPASRSATTPPLKTFHTNGVTLHYAKVGSGPPLLFIPGSVSDYRTWRHVQRKFADNYECYVVSRRFQYPGTYPAGGDSNVAANTDDIASFIKSKKLSPVIIIGHSFGGFVALNVAIQFPALVKCVVAEEPFFAPALARNPRNPLELLGLMSKNSKAGNSFARLGIKGMAPTSKALEKGDTITAQKTFIDGVTDGKKSPSTLDDLTRQQLADNIAALAGEDPFNNSISMADLKRIKCRTLLITGTESPYVLQYISEQLGRAIIQSQLVSFGRAGHWIHIDQTDKYVGTVANFLRK